MLANKELPRLSADKAGILSVTVRDVRNVLAAAGGASVAPEEEEEEEEEEGEGDEEGLLNGHHHKSSSLRFLVEVMPSTVVEEEGEDQVEIESLGGVASFHLNSLEGKVVVHFGPRLEVRGEKRVDGWFVSICSINGVGA